MLECADATKRKAGLQTELDHPTVARLYDEQVELLRVIKAASEKLTQHINELRAHRKATRKYAESGIVPRPAQTIHSTVPEIPGWRFRSA